MPLAGLAASEQIAAFLSMSIRRAQYTLAGCGVGWLLLASWVAFCTPDKLGPARFITALGLVAASSGAGLVWWFGRSWQHWLMVVLTELIPRAHGEDATAGINDTHAPGNLRLADTGRR